MKSLDAATRYLDAALKLLNPFTRGIEPAGGDKGLAIMRVKGINVETREVTGVLSTATIDRYGEVVLPSAFEKSLPQFQANPKFMAGHVYSAPDGRPTSIGSWTDVRITNEGLIGTAKFLPPGDALADAWWFRYANKAVRTFSVGFLAKAWEMRSVQVGEEKQKIRHFTEADLLEVSAVEIPANPDAMLRMAGAFGAAPPEARELPPAELSELLKGLLPGVEKLINEKLSAEPGGALHMLIQDVVEQVLSRGTGAEGSHHDHADENKTDPFAAALGLGA